MFKNVNNPIFEYEKLEIMHNICRAMFHILSLSGPLPRFYVIINLLWKQFRQDAENGGFI